MMHSPNWWPLKRATATLLQGAFQERILSKYGVPKIFAERKPYGKEDLSNAAEDPRAEPAATPGADEDEARLLTDMSDILDSWDANFVAPVIHPTGTTLTEGIIQAIQREMG
ncbi:hypothetical protein AWZ03_014794 [Drosophila navojoa]|uniref:Uncharacterized protein n=1 Tax=Drosophila navojoa TaxID=7232 RepID=A0A484AQU6_DRONA|nr:hypothetical protein AWZ03_014794 [Drosophila navojoa]